MEIDESFKKPGSVPFKWEIRPGVPKAQQQQKQPTNHHRSTPIPPQKLRPPPAGSYFQPPPELHTRSSRSVPRTRSERRRFDQPILARPESVSPGCYPVPLLKRKECKKRTHKPKPESEPDYTSDLETLARWSVSTRRFLSPFRGSPSSSFSSHQSSPRPVGDAEWAAFGLF